MNNINDFGREFAGMYGHVFVWQMVALSPLWLGFFGYIAVQFMKDFPESQVTPKKLIVERIVIRSFPLIFGLPILIGSWFAVTVYNNHYCTYESVDVIVCSSITLTLLLFAMKQDRR